MFTNLDKTLMTNVADRDPRLWVHLLSSYVISFVVWRVRASLVLKSPSCVAVPDGGQQHLQLVQGGCAASESLRMRPRCSQPAASRAHACMACAACLRACRARQVCMSTGQQLPPASLLG